MPFTSPTHLRFNHNYAETITIPEGQLLPEAFRVVTRAGIYATPKGYGAGVTFMERYGTRNLAFNGVGIDPAISVPNLKTAVSYPVGGTAVLAGAILKNANTNTFYTVPANATLDSTGTTLSARIALDVASGAVIEVPKNLILSNLNGSSTPNAPSFLEYQRFVGICTDGIAIVEVASRAGAASAGGVTVTNNLVKDQPLYVVDNAGRIGGIAAPAVTDIMIGRCMDDVVIPAAVPALGVPAGYIRIKLGSI